MASSKVEQKAMKSEDSWPKWLRVWFWTQLLVLSFDQSFVLLRPHSFPEGALGFIYPVFQKYMEVDTVYADMTVSYGYAQSVLGILENILLSIAMFYLHPREQNNGVDKRIAQPSDLLALCVASTQFGKSLFYWVNDAFDGFSHVSHNDAFNLITCYILPNLIWFIAPLFIFNYLGNKIVYTMKLARESSMASKKI